MAKQSDDDDTALHMEEIRKLGEAVSEKAKALAEEREVTPEILASLMEKEVQRYNSEANMFEILFEGKENINQSMVAHAISLRRRVYN